MCKKATDWRWVAELSKQMIELIDWEKELDVVVWFGAQGGGLYVIQLHAHFRKFTQVHPGPRPEIHRHCKTGE